MAGGGRAAFSAGCRQGHAPLCRCCTRVPCPPRCCPCLHPRLAAHRSTPRPPLPTPPPPLFLLPGEVTNSIVFNNGTLTNVTENTATKQGNPSFAVFPAGGWVGWEVGGCMSGWVVEPLSEGHDGGGQGGRQERVGGQASPLWEHKHARDPAPPRPSPPTSCLPCDVTPRTLHVTQDEGCLSVCAEPAPRLPCRPPPQPQAPCTSPRTRAAPTPS